MLQEPSQAATELPLTANWIYVKKLHNTRHSTVWYLRQFLCKTGKHLMLVNAWNGFKRHFTDNREIGRNFSVSWSSTWVTPLIPPPLPFFSSLGFVHIHKSGSSDGIWLSNLVTFVLIPNILFLTWNAFYGLIYWKNSNNRIMKYYCTSGFLSLNIATNWKKIYKWQFKEVNADIKVVYSLFN